jgi:ADP-ribose pyrophosphatase YjhB (NUDIX family)
MKDLTFDGEYGKFNVRVAVLVEHDNKLLTQNKDEYYWLIGGRSHFGEDSRQAIIREISEELCYEISDKDFLNLNFICENFFMWDDVPCHEILFIYRLILSDDSELIKKDNFKCGDNDKFVERWVNFEDLKNTTLVPRFILEYITHRDFKYCVIRDDKISD